MTPAHGAEPSEPASDALRQRAETLGLAQHVQWRRLLYVPPGTGRSQVNSPEFFLSGTRSATPDLELQATLHAWFEPESADHPDQHPRCRFPARYRWLAEQLGVPERGEPPPWCRTFRRWQEAHALRSVSLIMVGAYLGNPASSFGHTLLRLNSAAHAPGSSLTDTSLNFGALVPPQVGTLEYVVRGLAGGFEAGFSDAAYYTQDLTYTRTEFRDAWEYELQLDAASAQRLLAHLWEIVGKKFDYYFLTQNCATRMLELLQIATGDALMQRPGPWVLPVEVVIRLHAADQQRQQAGRLPLIRAVRFVPSAERALHAELQGLDSAQRMAWRQLVTTPASELDAILMQRSPQATRPVLDAALAYYEYAIKAQPYEQAESSPAHQGRAQVLRARFALAESTQRSQAIPAPAPPHAELRPVRVSAGLGSRAGHVLGWVGGAVYERPLLAPGRLDPTELVLGGWALLADGQRPDGAPRLDRLELLRVTKLAVRHVDVEHGKPPSWRIALGLESSVGRVPQSWGERYRLRSLASYGWAHTLIDPGVVGFAMLDLALRSSMDRYTLTPHVGLLWQTEQWAGLCQWGWHYESWSSGWRERAQFELKRMFTPGWSATLSATATPQSVVLVGLSAHW